MNTVSACVWYIWLKFSFSFQVKMQNLLWFIKVVIKTCFPTPKDPSCHSYLLHKYVRETSPPKGILQGGGEGGGGGGHIFIKTFMKHIQYSILASRLKAFLVLEKKVFKYFYHIWAWWPARPVMQNHLNTLSKGPMWNLVKIGQMVSEK